MALCLKTDTKIIYTCIGLLNNMPRRSRLSKKLEKRSKQNLILSILGILAILFLLIKYGIPFLGNVGFFFGQLTSFSNESTVNEAQEKFVPAPRLDSLPKATSDPLVLVTGTSLTGLVIDLYVNGIREDQVSADGNGEFGFEIILTEGENIIKTKARSGEKESTFSNSAVVVYKSTEPQLSIETPTDGSEIKGTNPITVSGSTDPDVSVTVNGFKAIIGANNSFSYQLLLVEGGNEITVVAQDLVGNTTEKIINVHYSQ